MRQRSIPKECATKNITCSTAAHAESCMYAWDLIDGINLTGLLDPE